MKNARIFVLLLSLLLAGSVTTYAQTSAGSPATTVPDTAQLKQYVGTYKVSSGDVSQIVVTIERGKLYGEAVGLGASVLNPDPKQADSFTVPDPNGGGDAYATVLFGRDAAGKVGKVVLSVQGQNYEGTRTN